MNPILSRSVVRTLVISREYLTKEHRDEIRRAEREDGNSTYYVEEDDAVLIEFLDQLGFPGPWEVDVRSTVAEDAEGIGWGDLAAIVRLCDTEGIEFIQFEDVKPFNDPNNELGLTLYPE